MQIVSVRDSQMSNLRSFALRFLAYVLPVITLGFWLTGPHSWSESLRWLLPMGVLYVVDRLAPAEQRQPANPIPSWPYNFHLYALYTIQIANHVLLVVTASKLSFHDADSIVQTSVMLLPTLFVAGTTASYSGITIGHELIHRHNRIEHTLGRILLGSVLYEHFSTEHVRGHHVRVGTAEDPVTAHYGETHGHFLRRTIPAQWRSAWHLEDVRLGQTNMAWYNPRRLRHRVLQGVIGEGLLLASIACFFGPIALVFYVGQALNAIMMLESVNYIEHWGLTRSGKKVMPVDSWDTDNWFTLHTLVGLSRHADHHAQASRPYHKLRHSDASPKMPLGYYGTIMKAIIRNGQYQRLATAELMRKRLGPFRADAREHAHTPARSSDAAHAQLSEHHYVLRSPNIS